MTRDDVIDALRALGVRRIPDPLPPFRPRCACGEHRGTPDELPAGHRPFLPGEQRCDGEARQLVCGCGLAFGLDVGRLMKHCNDDHGREATREERMPR